MTNPKPTFILRSKDKTLGRVEFIDDDWPWNRGRFHPSEEFGTFASIFAEAVRLHDAKDGDVRVERERAMRAVVKLELQLIREDSGILVGEPDLLWIRGDVVTWRGHSGAGRQLADAQGG